MLCIAGMILGMFGSCSIAHIASLSEEIDWNEHLVDWQEWPEACAGEILACLLSRVILARLNRQGKPRVGEVRKN